MRFNIERLLPLVFLFFSSIAFGQTDQKKMVKGVVKDEKGQPLSSITITEKGTNNATTSNNKGDFSIRLKNGNGSVIVFSGVGYETQEVKTGQQTNINIVLKGDVKALSDVIVIGYGSQNKAKVTGSISTVKMDAILGDRPVTSTANLLQGALPGLNVTIPTGQPGAAASNTTLNVRGGTGFSGNTVNTDGPFVVVDNVPYNWPLSLLDPNDIETVTLLKDAGSAAIYGSRSAYGVLLITTKKGNKNQKAQFNYSNNFVTAKIAPLDPKATPLQWVQHPGPGW